MTEEIIINCAFYKDGVCASPINKTCEYCKNIDVSKCYHKQLKRLEQDSKQLTQWLDEARRNADFWCDKCTSLEQENKQMKSALEEIKRTLLGVRGLSISCDKQIIKVKAIINEVLGC